MCARRPIAVAKRAADATPSAKTSPGRLVRSAASDWSRFPLGTRFRIVETEEEYIIDDYGTALVGTNTIDLYKTSTLEMRRWGVRHVDIDILEWGSDEASIKVLTPRAKHSCARRMLVALQKQKNRKRPARALIVEQSATDSPLHENSGRRRRGIYRKHLFRTVAR